MQACKTVHHWQANQPALVHLLPINFTTNFLVSLEQSFCQQIIFKTQRDDSEEYFFDSLLIANNFISCIANNFISCIACIRSSCMWIVFPNHIIHFVSFSFLLLVCICIILFQIGFFIFLCVKPVTKSSSMVLIFHTYKYIWPLAQVGMLRAKHIVKDVTE
jgi:hypothetical protein